MTVRSVFGVGALLLLAALLVTCGAPAGAQIEVVDAWARPAMAMEESGGSSTEGTAQGMGMAGTGAVFMTVSNTGAEADRLIGATTDVAKVVEIHETIMDGEVMKMQMLQDGLEIPARGEVILRPGSYHVMLIGIQRDLKVGDSFAVELQFEKSGSMSVEPEVRQP
ncbi:copper chaperone PCu(A)C [Chloroflexota bacterium]